MVRKTINTKRTARTRDANEAARKFWLAGLGAVSLAKKQSEKIVDTLVAEGEDFRARTGKFTTVIAKDARRTANDVQKRVKGYVTPIRNRVKSTLKDIESGVGDRIGAVLGRFGVPSKNDIDELLVRVSELNKQVKTTSRKKAA
jgi:poly(hydroxyalkanoate) granule-associated protein